LIERLPIPGAPSRALLAAYRDALVLRARVLLGSAEPARIRQGLATLDARFAELRGKTQFPVEIIVNALALSPLEREAVSLAAARHLDPGLGDDIRRFRGERPWVDGALVQALAAAGTLPGEDPLDPRGAIQRGGLVEPTPPRLDHVPALLELELVPTPRLLGLLSGEVILDPRLRDAATLMPSRPGGAWGIVPIEEWRRFTSLFAAALRRQGEPSHLLVTGGPGVGKGEVAQALAAEAGFSFVLVVGGVLLPRGPRELAHELERAAGEARLMNALLVVRDVPGDRERLAGLREALRRLETPVVLTATDEDAQPLRQVAPLHLALRRPDAELRALAWRAELAETGVVLAPEAIRDLAAGYPLPRPDVARAVELGTAVAADGPLTPAILDEAARVHLRSALARYGERVTSGVRLADLVLPEEIADQIGEIIQAVRHRPAVIARLGAGAKAHRRGIAALFDGPPGTGKTLAATVIANELELPLYRIDVSRIVDRYIGETEKNLAQIFEEAASDHAALVFDEADALFSRRVEVKDATDRYSNMQTGLLLTLIEEYEGLVMLTTNLKAGMDAALMRRIAYKLRFDVPRAPERLALWRRHLDGSVALAHDVDVESLASDYELTGGEIYNAVLRALLRAGAEGEVDQETLRRAVRLELESGGGLVAQSPSAAL
jgi:AAA+ superfamily predicted ATPase